MKTHYYSILFSLLLAAGSLLSADSVGTEDKWQWQDFSEAYPTAKMEGKHLIINFYSTSCFWCRKLDKETFADSAVSAQLAKDFIGAKVNTRSSQNVVWQGKSMTESDLALAFMVRGVPTTAFVDTAGEIIGQFSGFVPPETFIMTLKYVGGYWYRELTYQEFVATEEALKKQDGQ